MTCKPKITTLTLNPAIDLTIAVPNFRAGQVNRALSSQADPGGKGVNVASWLADYGFDVAVTGFLGAENDQIFRRLFEQKRIDDCFVRIAGSTRTGIKVVDPISQSTTDINFPGETPSQADLAQLTAIVEDLAAGSDWLVFSGSIPAGAPRTAYRDLIERASGKNVLLDTSGEAFRQAMLATPTIIKPNVDELSECWDDRWTVRARFWRRRTSSSSAASAQSWCPWASRALYSWRQRRLSTLRRPPWWSRAPWARATRW